MASKRSTALVVADDGDPFGDVERSRRSPGQTALVTTPRRLGPDQFTPAVPEMIRLNMPFEIDDLLTHVNAMFPQSSGTAPDSPAWGTLMTQGNHNAFAQLIDDRYRQIYRYVRSRISRVEDVEDVTQQVFLNAWGAVGRYEQRGAPLHAWLYSIARNLVTDFYRKKPVTSLDDSFPDGRADNDPEHVAVTHWQQERIAQAILLLTPIQGKVIVLRFGQRLAPRQIAVATGKSEANVRIIQYRALQKLRRMLEGERDECLR